MTLVPEKLDVYRLSEGNGNIYRGKRIMMSPCTRMWKKSTSTGTGHGGDIGEETVFSTGTWMALPNAAVKIGWIILISDEKDKCNEKCEVRQVGPDCFHISNGNRNLSLRLLDPQLRPELHHGSESPISGWVSRTFDVKEPTFTLAARGRITGLTQFLTEITPV